MRYAAVCVVLAWLPLAVASGQTTYDLRKVPTFGVGDRVRCLSKGSSRSGVFGKGKKLLLDDRRTSSGEIVREVLAVDAAGGVASLRQTVVLAQVTTEATAPKERAFRKTVALAGVIGTARYGRGRLRTDTMSILGAKGQTLTPSQIALLKRLFVDSIRFGAYDACGAALLPPGPVAVGAKWLLDGRSLARWAASRSETRRLGATVLSGKMRLVKVDDGVATVKGDLRLRAKLAGVTVAPKMELTFTLDLSSGRRRSESVRISLVARIAKDRDLVLDGRSNVAMVYTAGGGTASDLPADLRRLGWAPPGLDKNRFKDPGRGLSFDPPAAYRAQVPPGGDGVASFACKEGAHVVLSMREMNRPLDFADVLPNVMENLKATVKGFKLVAKESLVLPGNVPAVLVRGTGLGGKAVVVRLVAIDDRRVVTVSGAAPGDRPMFQTELTTIAKSLRVFAPAGEKDGNGK